MLPPTKQLKQSTTSGGKTSSLKVPHTVSLNLPRPPSTRKDAPPGSFFLGPSGCRSPTPSPLKSGGTALSFPPPLRGRGRERGATRGLLRLAISARHDRVDRFLGHPSCPADGWVTKQTGWIGNSRSWFGLLRRCASAAPQRRCFLVDDADRHVEEAHRHCGRHSCLTTRCPRHEAVTPRNDSHARPELPS
ncbi:hypothetical protein ABIG06_002119 [Bradyrhizobium sp. USDA 326]